MFAVWDNGGGLQGPGGTGHLVRLLQRVDPPRTVRYPKIFTSSSDGKSFVPLSAVTSKLVTPEKGRIQPPSFALLPRRANGNQPTIRKYDTRGSSRRPGPSSPTN